MKIITVREKAIGTSILLKMNTDKVLDQLGLDGDVKAADIRSAKGVASPADLVLTSSETAPKFDGLSTPVRVIDDFMNVEEISGPSQSRVQLGSEAAGLEE